MNPEKLFTYLDGGLSEPERSEIERLLANDQQLQKEMAIAREIHARARGDAREVLFQDETAVAAHGRKMALRIGAAFIALIALNVFIGLLFIARKEASNPNRKLLEARMREQLTKSLEQAAHSELIAPPLDVSDVTVPVAPGKIDTVADQIVATAKRLGGSATKGLPDNHRVNVLVDLTADREPAFRRTLATLTGGAPTSSSPAPANAPDSTKKSFVIQVVEPGAP